MLKSGELRNSGHSNSISECPTGINKLEYLNLFIGNYILTELFRQIVFPLLTKPNIVMLDKRKKYPYTNYHNPITFESGRILKKKG